MLEAKREVLRRSLKTEYIRQFYHPDIGVTAASKPHIFDTALYRYNAMTFTQGEFQFHSFRNFVTLCKFIVIPFGLYAYYNLKTKVSKGLR